MQSAAAPSVHSAASATTFAWDDMTNYVGQREQFVGNCWPQNEAKNESDDTKLFKMIFTNKLVDRIVCETSACGEQKIQARSLITFCSRM